MKALLKIIFMVLLIAPVYSYAQFSTKTKSSIPNQSLSKTQLNTQQIKAGRLAKVEPPKSISEVDINNFPIIGFSPEDLERSRQKYWEITPKKPYDPGMELTLWGTYTPSAFIMTPNVKYIINVDYDYYTYSSRLAVNLLEGKDYKLIFGIEPKAFPEGTTVLFRIGTSEFRIGWPSNSSELIVLFNNSFTGKQIIDFSPAIIPNRGKNRDGMQEFSIKSIRLEELTN